MSSKNSLIFLVALIAIIASASAVMIWQEKNSTGDKAFLDKLKKDVPESTSATSANTDNNASVAGRATPSPDVSSSQSLANATNSPTGNNANDTPTENIQTQPKDETADWKTYSNSTDNFEFKYPTDTSVSDSGDFITVSKDNKPWKIRIYNNKKKDNLETWYNNYFDEKERLNCTFSDSGVKVGSYETKYVNPNSGDTACAEDGYYALSSDKTKVVRVKIGKETVENVNKILETFKFDN